MSHKHYRTFILSLLLCSLAAVLVLTHSHRIEWPFLRFVTETVATYALTEPIAAVLTLLIALMFVLVSRNADIKSADAQQNRQQVRVQLMVSMTIEEKHHLLVRDYGEWNLALKVNNSAALDYVDKKMQECSFANPAICFDGCARGRVAMAALKALACRAMMDSGTLANMEWSLIIPAYWEDVEDVDVLRLTVIPEDDLRKYLSVNYCFETLVERPSHVIRILFMRDAALKHFGNDKYYYPRLELPIHRGWRSEQAAAVPSFERADIREAMIKLKLDLEETTDEVAPDSAES